MTWSHVRCSCWRSIAVVCSAAADDLAAFVGRHLTDLAKMKHFLLVRALRAALSTQHSTCSDSTEHSALDQAFSI